MSKKEKRKNKNHALPGTDIILYTDGGCEHNPGGRGAYGVVLYYRGRRDVQTFSEAFESTTNNRMELLAVIKALEKVRTSDPIVLYTDSKYVQRSAKEEYARRKNVDLWRHFDAVMKNKNVIFVWIPGHKGHKYNELCDKLCREAIESGPYHIDYGYVENETRKHEQENLFENSDIAAIARMIFNVSEEYDRVPDQMPLEEYCERYAVRMICAKQILYFYRYKFHAAKHYVGIKTGGSDYWSKIRDQEMRLIIGHEKERILRAYLDEKGMIRAAKWHCRGMTLSDAIRKVMIEEKIYQQHNSASVRQMGPDAGELEQINSR